MAAIANGGVLMRPALVRRIVDPATGEVLDEAPPRGRAARRVRRDRRDGGALARGRGRGREGHRPAAPASTGWRAAGKTGTAQKADAVSGGYSADRHFSSFVGFAPAEAPRIVIGVFIDEPKGEIYGGEVAAPAFREIAEYALKVLGVPRHRRPLAAAAPAPPEAPPSLPPRRPSEASGRPARSSSRRGARPPTGGGDRRPRARRAARRAPPSARSSRLDLGRRSCAAAGGSSRRRPRRARWWSAGRGSG